MFYAAPLLDKGLGRCARSETRDELAELTQHRACVPQQLGKLPALLDPGGAAHTVFKGVL